MNKGRFFPRLPGKTSKKKSGLSTIELLIVVTLVGLVLILIIFGMQLYLARARDARRKSDLQKIKIAFEEYYNDNGCYPPEGILDNCGGTELQPYLQSIPCDPGTGEPYIYIPNAGTTCSGYRVLTELEDGTDPAIGQVGCSGVQLCGFGSYNYGISEGTALPNDGSVSLPTPVPTPSPSPLYEGTYACAPGGVCNVYANPQTAGCIRSFADSNCLGQCGDTTIWCSY